MHGLYLVLACGLPALVLILMTFGDVLAAVLRRLWAVLRGEDR